MSSTLAQQTADLLTKKASDLESHKVVAGLDGFVDTIIHVVATRKSAEEYERMSEMTEFAKRIHDSAGLSANFEFVTQMVKLGGNGPIYAQALRTQGPGMTYIGNLGDPQMHPIFTQFSQSSKVFTLSEPGYTDAIEFDDGKLMCGKNEGLRGVTWKRILEVIPFDDLVAKFQEASLAALVNWTMIVHMTDIMENILLQVAPKLTGDKRWIFFDLADPAKRTREDLRRALDVIARFEKHFKVILGLNLQEARQVAGVLGLPGAEDDPESVTKLAASIRDAMDVENVVVHPTAFAAAAERGNATYVKGPFTPKPKITTGAGDHFNAGYCIGRLAGGTIAESLQVGVGTSGYYVRNAGSPNVRELAEFLKSL